MTEEKERATEDMKQLLTAIYNLSFANNLIFAMQQLKGRTILQAEEAYGEIFDNPSVRPFFHFFLGTDERGRMKLSSLGDALERFITHVHRFLDDEDTIARINKTFDLELSNPLRDLVYSVIKQFDEKEKKVARVAATISSHSYAWFDRVSSGIKDKFGLELSMDEIKDINEKMRMFLLSTSDTSFDIPEQLRRHILEATKDLERTQ
ncbi:hypothetical protein M1N84_04370 [Dehalococcoidia bacterium]|nr:hypothetical protein [Dehalococcoidia bacterium]